MTSLDSVYDVVAGIALVSDEDLKSLRLVVRAEQKKRRISRNPKLSKRRARAEKKALNNPPEKDRVRHWTLYTLYLNGGNYYVGITAYKTTKTRYEQHTNGKGAKWTKLHKPSGILDEKYLGFMPESSAIELETAKTIEMIDLHGINKVRGGKIVAVSSKTAQTQYNKFNKPTITTSKKENPLQDQETKINR